MGLLSQDKKYFVYTYVYRIFSIVKSELNGLILLQIELVNLILLAEDQNGSQQQGFQSGQAKVIEVNFITDFLLFDHQIGRETICYGKPNAWFKSKL